ncbi:MAG: hypothetical protein HKL90_12720 [Elusimicrobia bacterium]|nr:hypothetical protein [Elusimicrobiota bacterium]
MSHEAHELRGAEPGRGLLFLLLAAALAAALTSRGRIEERAAIAAVDVEPFARLAGRPAAADAELWERLKAMGVGAAVLREETLADLAARGDVAYFPRAEVGRWRAAGLLPLSSTLRGGTLWARDAQSQTRAAEALAAAGVDASTAPATSGALLRLPPGADLSLLPAGFDPPTVAALSAAGLLPVAASSGPAVAIAGRRMWTRTLPVDASRGEIARAAFGRPLRLIVFRARPELGFEGNLDALRVSVRTLRALNLPEDLPEPSVAPEESSARTRARLALVWIIGLIGPLLAARAGLHASRFLRHPTRAVLPQASPVPQALGGLAAAWACAALAGLAVAGLAPEGWRDGGARAWTLWTWCAPLAVAGATLLAAAAPARRGWAAPVRRRDLAALGAFALAAVLLAAPRATLRASSLWESFDRLSAAAGALWWWPWRWREALVGAPALALAYALIEERDSAAPSERPVLLAVPRAWLLLGLLAPAGLIAAVGGGGEPVGAALAHGAVAQALGALLGAVLAGLRDLLDGWA